MKFKGMKDITGKRFTKLLAIEPLEVVPKKGVIWNCLCDCGNYVKVPAGSLNALNTRSCGCLVKENAALLNKSHGLWTNNRKVYSAWRKIKERCFDENCPQFETYGAKGITLEDRFVNDFAAFFQEIGPPPENTKKWSIDRIDPNRGYLTGNMRWTTPDKQARNTRMYKTNSSGKSGVVWSINGSGGTRAVAMWIDLDGKPRSKTFPVAKHGLLPAFKLACEYRDRVILELNIQGAGYTPDHGK